MAANRSAGRDVQLYDANDPTTVLGGLILTNGVTNVNFYSMIEVFLLFGSEYVLRHEDGTELQRNDQALRRGSYFIVTDGTVTVINEPWLVRTISVGSGTRVAEFREAVRQRDRRCVITGERIVSARGSWTGFEAAHIFPLAHEGNWKEHNFGHWISIHPSTGGSINSVQNGLLLRADVHNLFDSYDVSINPDDNYKVVCFDTDSKGIAGNYIEFGNDERRPVDQLLRWHFRQAVFANMRGAGAPVFECDFPPGSDMMGEIRNGPMAAERMEFEMCSRLAV
ncbi:HNH endonuclease-domain-containing protein [Terfezia claveryi]|nr:HNH endonuclease-domain-containing protein [Terfezia claveryi]